MTHETYPRIEAAWLEHDGPLKIVVVIDVNQDEAIIEEYAVDRDDFAGWVERELNDALKVEEETIIPGTADVTVGFWKIDPYDAIDGHVDFTEDDLINYLKFKKALIFNTP